MKTMNDLMNKALELFPDALVEKEDDGNIVIITNMQEDADGNLIEFEEEEDKLMKKYSVQATFSGGYVFEIEAENEEQAREIASEREVDLASVDYWDTDLQISEEE